MNHLVYLYHCTILAKTVHNGSPRAKSSIFIRFALFYAQNLGKEFTFQTHYLELIISIWFSRYSCWTTLPIPKFAYFHDSGLLWNDISYERVLRIHWWSSQKLCISITFSTLAWNINLVDSLSYNHRKTGSAYEKSANFTFWLFSRELHVPFSKKIGKLLLFPLSIELP